MLVILDWINCIAWSLAYIAAIIIGIKRRTWCIPGVAICVAFSWELLIVIFQLLHGELLSRGFLIQSIWLALDIPILLIWLLLSHMRWKNLLVLGATMGITFLMAYTTENWAQWAFAINLLISLAFIWRKVRDRSPWTSLWIACCKLIGTLAATIGDGLLNKNPIILWLGGLCLLADIYYIILLLMRTKGEEICKLLGLNFPSGSY